MKKVPPYHLHADANALRDYNLKKLQLGQYLSTARNALNYLGCETAAKALGTFIVKLAEDRFTLAVLGQFKRGKSSLMNAIIGKELLPTGVLPLTSVITELQYGPEEKLQLLYEGRDFMMEKEVSELPDYVTEKGNPGNEKKLTKAILEVPRPFLRQGVHFVDTPGIGSAIEANTATTYSFLPQCDAALFVTGAENPLTNAELHFLRDVSQYVPKIFFILNKIDLIADPEEIIRFIQSILHRHFPKDQVELYPVSATRALAALGNEKHEQYQQSGIPQLEQSLSIYLSGEKYTTLIHSLAGKSHKTIARKLQGSSLSESAIAAREKRLKEDKTRFTPDLLKLKDVLLEVGAKLEKMTKEEAVAEKPTFKNLGNLETSKKETQDEDGGVWVVSEANAKQEQDAGHCPVCAYLRQVTFDYLAHFQYELSTDEKTQIRFAKSLGFCPRHNWQLARISSPQGMSKGLYQMALLLSESTTQNQLEKWTHEIDSCDLCQIISRQEKEFVKTAVKKTNTPGWQKTYEKSSGFCLQHLVMLLQEEPAPEIKIYLLQQQSSTLQDEAADMLAYVVKREATKSGLINRNEEKAWMNILERIAGLKN